MRDSNALYLELKPAIEQVATPLFDASQLFIKKRGAFLPHGAVLKSNGEVESVMAAPPGFEERLVSPTEVLPLLHEALRLGAREDDLAAVGVCEDVSITLEGQAQTRAIKVLIEHRRGLSTALYLPFRRKLFGYSFGDVFAIPAKPEVNPWIHPDAV